MTHVLLRLRLQGALWPTQHAGGRSGLGRPRPGLVTLHCKVLQSLKRERLFRGSQSPIPGLTLMALLCDIATLSP